MRPLPPAIHMPRAIHVTVTVLLLLTATASLLAGEPATDRGLASHVRRPIVLVRQGDQLLVGNRRSGTISQIDLPRNRVVAEYRVARRIADMAPIPGSTDLLVLDDEQRQLLRVARQEGKLVAEKLAPLPESAARLAIATQPRRVFATATWPRRLVTLTFDASFQRVVRTTNLPLPFAPRDLLLLEREARLLVADAFGGRLAVVDALQPELLSIHGLQGHNIRGLALNAGGSQILVAHQQLTPRARADYEELHWGRMVRHGVQWLELADLLRDTPEASTSRTSLPHALHGWFDQQGDIGGAAGDPGDVITGPGGFQAVSFSGVGEVAVRHGGRLRRIPVGRHPEAMLLAGDDLYVANRFDDSLSVIDLERGAVRQTISLGPAPQLTSAQRGELLFFDARLSHDGWLSCHSCHTDGHSSGLLVDTLGDGDYGAPKRIPSLLGTTGTGPWGWTGSAATLDEQVRKSVLTTMHGEPLDDHQVADLVAYLESLPAAPPREFERQQRAAQELVARGRQLFAVRGCGECHAGPRFTSSETFDVGLADEQNRRQFNPPSLRGVGQRSPLLHDGRAAGLRDLLGRVRHQLAAPLSDQELEALRAYLRSL